jgi:lipopolysaccharide/colanic/teichoic acid biosynthesis glycosyltransferase/glycosyltransferase involved in cell wall biosynthesis
MSTSPTLFVTLVVPCRNEEAFMDACLQSLLENDYPRDRREILVVDGDSSDGTRAIAERFAMHDPTIRVIANPRGIIPAAMNIGIAEARGEAILKIDAHSTYAPNYVSRCVALLAESGADNTGGVLVTRPRNESAVATAIALALAHPFGSGNSGFRIGASEPREADTVAFGCYRKDVFDRIGGYNERLVRSSDMDLNTRLRRAGGRIVLDPAISANYYPVARLDAFAQRNLLDGYWATYPLRFGSTFIRWRHAAPLICLMFALLVLALAAASPRLGVALLLVCAASYVVTVAWVSLSISRRERRRALFPPLVAVFSLRHSLYAVGSVWGFIRALTSPEAAKRVFDVIAALAGIAVTSPALLCAVLLIKRHDRGPVLYRGQRVGLDGRPFAMLKFRTMVVRAEALGGTSTSSDDARLTPIGKQLRRYKLDELPQLFNVLRGDMSMVGPRPQVKWAVDLYGPHERQLLSVRPGITDYASIRFRNEADILKGAPDPDKAYLERIAPEKIRLGLDYVADHSFAVDLRILLATAWTIAGGNPNALLGRELEGR